MLETMRLEPQRRHGEDTHLSRNSACASEGPADMRRFERTDARTSAAHAAHAWGPTQKLEEAARIQDKQHDSNARRGNNAEAGGGSANTRRALPCARCPCVCSVVGARCPRRCSRVYPRFAFGLCPMSVGCSRARAVAFLIRSLLPHAPLKARLPPPGFAA